MSQTTVVPNASTLLSENARLKAQVEALQAKANAAKRISLKVSEKGMLSLYHGWRFPVTLDKETWTRIIEAGPQILQFIQENDSRLTLKGE